MHVLKYAISCRLRAQKLKQSASQKQGQKMGGECKARCGSRAAPAEAPQVKFGRDAQSHHAILLDEVQRHVANSAASRHHLPCMAGFLKRQLLAL